jgi:hypothetical protein
MTEKNEPTQEEKQRDVALKNLKANTLMDLAATYLVYKNKKYGDEDNDAMENFKYFPAFNSGAKAYAADGTEYNVVQNSILKSREKGVRYSGNVSEVGIMKDCSQIINESLNSVKISDIMGLMGSKANVKDAYLGSLVSKLSEDQFKKLPKAKQEAIEAQEELYGTIIGSYQSYLTKTKVSESLAQGAKEISKGLEKMLAIPEEKKK